MTARLRERSHTVSFSESHVASGIFETLVAVRNERGAGFIVLIDPDKLHEERLPRFVDECERAGVDAFFVGGSLMHAVELNRYVHRLKAQTQLPVVGFPGSLNQLSPHLDAVLYLSIVSGRNPEYLIGQHVHAAPVIRRLQLEPIPTAYMLVESGRTTTAQYMSHTRPLPRNKPDVAAATALAAEMMGMRLLFTDGGSGADQPVPEEVIAAITDECEAPLIVGGGLQRPEQVATKVRAGASFIVVGNAIEQRPDGGYIAELAAAAHSETVRAAEVRP